MQTDDDKRGAYFGLRHLSPDSVRLIRGALDFGATVDELRARIKKHSGDAGMIQMTLDALDYMASNPQVGIARFIEGESYTWESE